MDLPLAIPATIAAHLPRNSVEAVQVSLSSLKKWTASLPKDSHFYVNQRVVSRKSEALPSGVTPLDLAMADTLFDVHSFLAGQCLLKSWRADQLSDGLTNALSSWNITLAALATRALIETASAWALESGDLAAHWNRLKSQAVNEQSDALRVRQELYKESAQLAWGTRLGYITKENKAFQRTNIVTLVQRAAKTLGYEQLWEEYEILCDAVHPSWGASECFWAEAGHAPEVYQMRVLISREAIGQIKATYTSEIKPGSPLSTVVFAAATWALGRLADDLRKFDQMCRDICLTGRIYILSNMNYWGVAKPSGPYDPCSCGSGRKSRFCSHAFGPLKAT